MTTVRIISDGHNATVYDADTGEQIIGLAAVAWAYRDDARKTAARLELTSVHFDGIAPAEFLVRDPQTGKLRQVARIEFVDGTVREF